MRAVGLSVCVVRRPVRDASGRVPPARLGLAAAVARLDHRRVVCEELSRADGMRSDAASPRGGGWCALARLTSDLASPRSTISWW